MLWEKIASLEQKKLLYSDKIPLTFFNVCFSQKHWINSIEWNKVQFKIYGTTMTEAVNSVNCIR